ncbi:MAG TPA: VOC family protein [Solirubrobacteraceae bacterium]|jgi:catechol 2,3-dioxygenase|nr:VOC family protein [Solirubrobacteraceae bacterium]
MSAPAIDPALRVASATLAVADLDRSVAFYEQALGLRVADRSEARALLGIEGAAPALALEAIERPQPLQARRTGLFHVAWLHPSRAALAATVNRVLGAGWRLTGASDHGVSEALYLDDPDGLGIEIYADRPRERWQRAADGRGVVMVTLPLDVDDLLAQDDGPLQPEIAAGTHIGHVHMKVADVPRATAFYRDALGFELEAQMPSAAFLAAGGYHHHIGLNSWMSLGAERAAESEPGLRGITFALGGQGAVDAVAAAAGVEPAPGALELMDPDGQQLRFAPA